MKRLVAMVMALVFSISLTSTAWAAPVDYGAELNNQPEREYQEVFSDVPKNHWAFSYIAEMVDKGVVSGYPDGLFRPGNLVKRGEFAKIMVNASGLKPTAALHTSFADVSLTDWYCPYIETAKTYLTGYIVGGQTMYLPDIAALREDITVALVRLKGYDTSVADLGMLQAMFSDYDGISAAAKPYVAVAVERGLVSGYEDGTFRAQKSITRAEAATLLWRANQYGNDNKVPPVIEPDQPAPEVPPVTEPDPPSEDILPPYTHTMDTVARGIRDFRAMVLTDAGDVYYIDDNTLCATNSRQSINLETDLSYPLNKDDKNKDFSIDMGYLAYDSRQDKVYLLANEGFAQGPYSIGNLVVYDVTDISNPVAIMASDLEGNNDSYKFALETNSLAEDIYVLNNGAILVPSGSEYGLYMVFPESATIERWAPPFGRVPAEYGIVVGNRVMYLEQGDTSMEVAHLTSPQSKTTVSIEGSIPAEQSSCAGPDGLYFWENREGVSAIDVEGYRHQIAQADKIECVDFSPLPSNVWDVKVNMDGTCALYDNTSNSIRIIERIAK